MKDDYGYSRDSNRRVVESEEINFNAPSLSQFEELDEVEYLAKAGFSNSMIEAAIEVNNQRNLKYQEMVTKIKENEQQFHAEKYSKMSSLKDFNAYENMPELRMSAMMNRRQQDPINQFNEESQVLSLGTYKNGDETEQRSGLIKQGYYQHFKGNEYPGDQIQTRNLYQSIKGENELYIDGTTSEVNKLGQTDFRNQLDSNIFPGPIRQKIKGNKYRKKSKLKEAKLLKGKESVNSNSINKPKAYKLGQTKARLEASESTAKNSSGKSSSNSFIFMKNNPHSLRKASSNVPNIGDEQQDNQDQISTSDKNTGASTQPTTIGEKASMLKSGAKVK